MIRLIDYHDFEPLPRILIHLLRLRDLLEQILHDDPIKVADVAGGDFEMVDGGDDVELEFAIRGRLEDAGVDLDLFHAGAVERAQGGDYAGLFASTRGAVDEEVREVGGLSLYVARLGLVRILGDGWELRGSSRTYKAAKTV